MKRLLAVSLSIALALPLTGQRISLETTLDNLPTSVRGLSVVDDNTAWFSGSKGYVGRTINGGRTWQHQVVKGFESSDFRSIYAFDSLHVVISNAGSPGYVLKTSNGGRSWNIVWQSNHPDIFLDGIDFWDAASGMLYGDPIEGRMMILTSQDSGDHWTEAAPSARPLLNAGEASFAASGTGIRCIEPNTVIVTTGGTTSRVWHSADRGMTWTSRPVPINQGKPSAGIFSIGISNLHWIVVGGDYMADTLRQKHVFTSTNSGATWTAPAKATGGYRSCVERIADKTWLAAGQGGIDVSNDNGMTWTSATAEKGFHVIRKARNGTLVLLAGSGKVARLSR